MNNERENSALDMPENSIPLGDTPTNSEVQNEENLLVSSETVSPDSLVVLDDSQGAASDSALDSISIPDLDSSIADSTITQQVVVVSPDNFMLKPLDEYTVTEACLLMLVAFVIFFGIFTLFTKRWW